jgi:hypothetical protein
MKWQVQAHRVFSGRNPGSDRIYGISEIAKELGIKRQTVAQWHYRGKLPKPIDHQSLGFEGETCKLDARIIDTFGNAR